MRLIPGIDLINHFKAPFCKLDHFTNANIFSNALKRSSQQKSGSQIKPKLVYDVESYFGPLFWPSRRVKPSF
jgi:hypothetical protein